MNTTLSPRGVDCFTNAVVEVPEVLNLDSPLPSDNIHWKIVTKKTGHRHVSWGKENQIQMSAARILWESFIAEGLEPFKVDGDGKATGTKLTEFDAGVESVIFMPKAALQGG